VTTVTYPTESVLTRFATLHARATIARTAHELAHLLHQPRQDLEALLQAVARLSPATVALFRANADVYRQQLRFYEHVPQGIRDAWKRLMASVHSLTARLEASGREEVFAPLPKLPAAPADPRVETA
jgi:hypothetical protein